MGYQSSPEFIDSEKVREFTVHMTKEARYAPRTIWITLRALELYSERAGLAVSVEAAHGVLDSYRASLAPHGEARAPGRARRRRSRWVH